MALSVRLMGPTTSYIGRIKNNDFLLAFLISAGWHLLLFIVGSFTQILNGQNLDLLGQTNHWDAGWYHTVLRGHYQTDGASAAFYPLFPLLVGIVHFISFGTLSYLASGLIINLLASWLAVAALLKIARRLLSSSKQSLLVVLLFLTYPAAFFMHAFYSEAVFCALGFWAYYWALQRKWDFVGIALGVLTASRLPAVLFITLCLLEYLRSCGWSLKRVWKPSLAWFLLAPLGFISYAAYLAIVRNDALGMFHAYHYTTDWAYHQLNPNIIATFLRAAWASFEMLIGQLPLTPANVSNLLLPTIALLLLLGASVYLIFIVKDWGIPLGLMGLGGFAMFTLNNNVVSVHRYALPMIGIYVALAHLIGRIPRWKLPITLGIIVANATVMTLLLALFITDQFAG